MSVGEVVLFKLSLTGVPQYSRPSLKLLNIFAGRFYETIYTSSGTRTRNRVRASISTIVWDKICRSKCEWGLVIRKTDDLIAAFLEKQG